MRSRNHIPGFPATLATPSFLQNLTVVIFLKRRVSEEKAFQFSSSATWEGQGGVSRPSWTDSGGQVEAKRGANCPKHPCRVCKKSGRDQPKGHKGARVCQCRYFVGRSDDREIAEREKVD